MAADPIVTLGDATPAASTGRAPASTTSAGRLRLVLLSFLMLFVELALIRWTAANNVYLASLTNFVLLASFLGIGIGFLRADSRWSLLPLAPVVLALLVGFVLAFPVSINVLGVSHLLHGAQGLPLLPEWLSVSVVFLLVAATLAAIGQEVARSFQRVQPAGGVSARHSRQPAGDHGVFDAVVPMAPADRVGRGRLAGALRVDLARAALVADRALWSRYWRSSAWSRRRRWTTGRRTTRSTPSMWPLRASYAISPRTA